MAVKTVIGKAGRNASHQVNEASLHAVSSRRWVESKTPKHGEIVFDANVM
jgi:hypothetical protein